MLFDTKIFVPMPILVKIQASTGDTDTSTVLRANTPHVSGKQTNKQKKLRVYSTLLQIKVK